MTTRAIVEVMKLKGTVKNGVVAVDLPEGTSVTVSIDDQGEDRGYELDPRGRLIMTPELEASIAAGEAEADRGEGFTIDEARAYLERHR
jgi:hypothetical protein